MTMIKLSTMTGKLEGVQAINSDPLSNRFCMAQRKKQQVNNVCNFCYSCRMVKSYRSNCRPGWRKNGLILSLMDLKEEELPVTSGALVRIHAHGELLNYKHAVNMIRIARKNPQSVFGFWTKRANIVQRLHKEEEIPDNVIFVFSNEELDSIMDEPPEGFHKVFNVVTKEDNPRINCGQSKCLTCRLCYRKETTQCIVEHLVGDEVPYDEIEEHIQPCTAEELEMLMTERKTGKKSSRAAKKRCGIS